MFWQKESFEKKAKALGYKIDQDGIISRYLREETGWKQHLQNTRDYILNAASGKNKKSVCVLGSGWLLDVPLNELIAAFEMVYLVDIIHPAQICNKVKSIKNVKLITADITGGTIEAVYEAIKQFKKNKIKTKLNDLSFDSSNFGIDKNISFDFVVSVNILNQLDILVVDNLKKLNIYNDDELFAIKRRIQQSHLDALKKFSSTLITDYEEINIDRQLKSETHKPLVFVNLENMSNKKFWQWNFDKNGLYEKGKETFFNVVAGEIN